MTFFQHLPTDIPDHVTNVQYIILIIEGNNDKKIKVQCSNSTRKLRFIRETITNRVHQIE